jgi:hypothetical protein
MEFTLTDLSDLKARGITTEEAELQIMRLRRGVAYPDVLRPAVAEDGIIRLDETQINELLQYFAEESGKHNLLKFVPASGAATRMFQALIAQSPAHEQDRIEVLNSIEKLAFFPLLEACIEKDGSSVDELKQTAPQTLFDYILYDKGLGYLRMPKGLIPFHTVKNQVRTAFEEHLHEGAIHCAGQNKVVKIHFTVQQEWQSRIETFLEDKANEIRGFDVSAFELSYSIQSSATDTLAIDSSGNPLRSKHGRLVFRPGGHGALLPNLNALRADLIFIKNIDNVVSDRHKYQGLLHKKVLAGLALELRTKIFRFQREMSMGRVPLSLRREMQVFCEKWLFLSVPPALTLRENKPAFVQWMKNLFNRPLRVCGMVPNLGEPGGGPYWVKDSEGNERLQIVEKAQFDLNRPEHLQIISKATHFNPVDLVCIISDFTGKPYDLKQFTDPESVFISEKTFEGEPIKALELPGLWNGAMARWNTVFVEVPAATFGPVKTVNDLLKTVHQ